METILISACLLGVNCRYDGRSMPLPDTEIQALQHSFQLLPVCCEVYGGLTTPRAPSEIRNDRVYANDGREVTAEFRRGAAEILALAARFGCRRAILKAYSPSCGCGEIYDGSFSGILVPGNGVLAQRLLDAGYHVYTEAEVPALLREVGANSAGCPKPDC